MKMLLDTPEDIILPALVSGTAASLATTATLALLARAEHKGLAQPTNSTSHWLHGETAGSVRDVDLSHTLVGYATHHASSVFWALLFEALNGRRSGSAATLGNAAIVSAVAATVDYGTMPKRLTPGWESVLGKRSIAATFAAMAVGLAAGALVDRRLRGRTRERLGSRRSA